MQLGSSYCFSVKRFPGELTHQSWGCGTLRVCRR